MLIKKNVEFYSQFLLIGVAFLVILISWSQSRQSSMAFMKPIIWCGEYSTDGVTWNLLEEDTTISAVEKDLILRIKPNYELPEGSIISFYLNHINMIIYKDGKPVYESSAEAHYAGEHMCGKQWSGYLTSGIKTDEVIEIHLHNPHSVGNIEAYNDFLRNAYGAPNETVSVYLAKHYNPWRLIGIVAMIVAFILLGICVATVLMRLSVGWKLWMLGVVSFFMGGYIYIDNIDTLLRMESVIFNTYASYICWMIVLYVMQWFLVNNFTFRRKQVGRIILWTCAAMNIGCLIAPLMIHVKLYDTLGVWLILHIITVIVLVICGVIQLRNGVEEKVLFIVALLMIIGFELEMLNVFLALWQQGLVIKNIFIGLFMTLLLIAIKVVPENYRYSLEADRLEDELKKSRSTLALSQIRAHFIFNVLNAISGMCKYDPEKADETVVRFARYLRRNIDILEKDGLVRFTEDLEHVEDYVTLEKIRFGEKITFVKEIEFSNFSLPPLVLQPIVENAIKHGLSNKKTGGTIRLKTSKQDNMVIITVCDDGIGYDIQEKENGVQSGGNGIALENVRFRLHHMANGTLHIDGNKETGTTVTIKIPREEN